MIIRGFRLLSGRIRDNTFISGMKIADIYCPCNKTRALPLQVPTMPLSLSQVVTIQSANATLNFLSGIDFEASISSIPSR